MIPKIPAPGAEVQRHKRDLKDWMSNFGALMRFGFSENCVAELQRLAHLYENDRTTLKGLQQLAKSLWLAETPTDLNLPSVESPFLWKGVPAKRLLEERRRLFPEQPNEFRVQERDFSYLAVRDDLPDMLPEDQEHLIRTMESVLSSKDFEAHGRSMSQEDYLWEHYRAWYARYAPQRLLDRMSEFREKAFTS